MGKYLPEKYRRQILSRTYRANEVNTGFPPFKEQKIQGLFQDFQGSSYAYSRTEIFVLKFKDFQGSSYAYSRTEIFVLKCLFYCAVNYAQLPRNF